MISDFDKFIAESDCDCDFCQEIRDDVKSYDKEMKIHYEELYETAVNELQEARLYIEHLLNIIDEIQVLNKDTLIDKLIDNGLERHYLDKLCHSRVLFDE